MGFDTKGQISLTCPAEICYFFKTCGITFFKLVIFILDFHTFSKLYQFYVTLRPQQLRISSSVGALPIKFGSSLVPLPAGVDELSP